MTNHNIFENKESHEEPPTEYQPLQDLISFQSFNYENYRDGEKTLLQPQLEHLGYTNIEWRMGEFDSWGPLSRVCRCKDHFGATVWFVYG